MAKGQRLYCPVCRDNGFFTDEQLASVDNKVDCGNHATVVHMVNLAEYFIIMGIVAEKPAVVGARAEFA